MARGLTYADFVTRICAEKDKEIKEKEGGRMLKHAEITEKIVQAFYRVYNTLRHGFLEKVYEKAMVIELRKRGVTAQPQEPITVRYEGEVVGDYFADLLVEGLVIVEIKAAETLTEEHHAQIINHLKATDIEVGLLVNFGPKPELKRKVFETARKQVTPPS
jgi:GxxExxY protein